MKVSCIIPCLYHVDGEYLKVCVESLRASGFVGQIIVVTNGSKDKPILKHIGGISVHIHTHDQGQCVAVNVGAQMAEVAADYLMVSNADMYYAPGWDRNLRFNGLVFSPNLVEPTDNLGSAPPFLKLDAGFTLDRFNKEKVDKFVAKETGKFIGPKEESGFNLPFFIRRDVWRTIGGYDTAYDPWGSNSDTDLQTMINLAGITPVRLRDVLVYHFSNKSGTFEGHQDYWQKNWNYFDGKWGFNRDSLGSDVWTNKDMLPDPEDIKYEPEWAWKYLDEE